MLRPFHEPAPADARERARSISDMGDLLSQVLELHRRLKEKFETGLDNAELRTRVV